MDSLHVCLVRAEKNSVISLYCSGYSELSFLYSKCHDV